MGPQWFKDSLVLHPLMFLRASPSTNSLLSLLLFALPPWISISILIMCNPESFLFYPFSCVYAFHCVVVHSTCVCGNLRLTHPPSSFQLTHWGRLNQSNLELTDTAFFTDQLAIGIPFLAPEAGLTDDLICPLIYVGSGILILVLTFAQQVCTCWDICPVLKYYF